MCYMVGWCSGVGMCFYVVQVLFPGAVDVCAKYGLVCWWSFVDLSFYVNKLNYGVEIGHIEIVY